jgi:hypothetical protein
MDRTLSQRIRNVEKLLSKAEGFVSLELKKRAELLAEFSERHLRPGARLHAIAVAAIVIYGEPRTPASWRMTKAFLQRL